VPLYEYRCRSCGHLMEALQRFSDPPLKRCESCGGKLEKLISRSAFHLKGGGWYAEGYGKPKPAPKKDGADKKPAKSETAAGGSSSSETKKKSSKPDSG
jgi:putative FmdB family regulatory protein